MQLSTKRDTDISYKLHQIENFNLKRGENFETCREQRREFRMKKLIYVVYVIYVNVYKTV